MLERLPRRLLHLEGLAVLVAALAVLLRRRYGRILLVVLFLAPDLSIIGYIGGPRVGALTYDVVHTYVLPMALGVFRRSRRFEHGDADCPHLGWRISAPTACSASG